MKPTNRPLSLLTHDLQMRSSGSPGRELMARIEDSCTDLLGAANALDFALTLRSENPAVRHVLEGFLEWTAFDNDFLLIGLVALATDLEGVALRLSWGRPNHNTVAEVLTQATHALRWTYEVNEGERSTFVVAHALTKTRTEQRRASRHNVVTTTIPDDFDAEEREGATLDGTMDVLGIATSNHVITLDDAALIQRTRRDKESLRAIAKGTGVSYDALRMRRSRAEDAVRHYIRDLGLRP